MVVMSPNIAACNWGSRVGGGAGGAGGDVEVPGALEAEFRAYISETSRNLEVKE